VAVARSGRVYPLAEMAALAATPLGRAALSPTDVRIYTKSDYLTRWSEYFGWTPLPPATTDTVELAARFAVARRERGKTQKQVADELGLDPSFLSRLLAGKARWPQAASDRVRGWIESGEAR
jgi:hypothetical protein